MMKYLLCLSFLLACAKEPEVPQNPSSLWVSFSQREVDLILVYKEPPTF
jgi:hypothetical protein